MEKKGFEVNTISLLDQGLLGFFLKNIKKFKNRNSLGHQRINRNSSTSLMFITSIIQFLLGFFDVKTSNLIRKSCTNARLVIVISPWYNSIINSRKIRSNLILYLTNDETTYSKFHLEMTDIHSIFKKIINLTVSKIQNYSIYKANEIWCVSNKDLYRLKSIYPLKNISKYYPFNAYSFPPIRSSSKITKQLNSYFNIIENENLNPTIVGFLGSNSSLNIVAVDKIIELAGELKEYSKSIKFLIVGSVLKAYKDRKDIPSNVNFTGYVVDPVETLMICDFLLNYEIQPTGIEVKLTTYARTFIPVIRIGERSSDILGQREFFVENENQFRSLIIKYSNIKKKKSVTPLFNDLTR